jgi:hypothetical protein
MLGWRLTWDLVASANESDQGHTLGSVSSLAQSSGELHFDCVLVGLSRETTSKCVCERLRGCNRVHRKATKVARFGG